MLSLQKNYFFSLFSLPDFLFEISVISTELFLRGGVGNSLKRAGYMLNEQEQTKGGGGGLKSGSFERTYFLNDPERERGIF